MTINDLIHPEDQAKMIANHNEQLPLKGTSEERDFLPVCLLRFPFSGMWWLLTELDPEEPIAFGLCHITDAELGSVWLPELLEVRHRGLRVIQDTSFRPRASLSNYVRFVQKEGPQII